jgi:hypothetical protein
MFTAASQAGVHVHESLSESLKESLGETLGRRGGVKRRGSIAAPRPPAYTLRYLSSPQRPLHHLHSTHLNS